VFAQEGERDVLKITRARGRGGIETIKIEGEILGPWVASIYDVCTQGHDPPQRLALDLAAVSYVDRAGARLLRDLLQHGVEITNCSNYVRALLNLPE